MEVKVFGSKRGSNYKSICAQCNLKRKQKSESSKRNKRKYIFVPAAWTTQALRRTALKSPQDCAWQHCNVTTTLPWPQFGHHMPKSTSKNLVGHRSHTSLWTPRNVSVSNWQWDGWIPGPLPGSFAQVQRERRGLIFPVQSSQEEWGLGFTTWLANNLLQSTYSFLDTAN